MSKSLCLVTHSAFCTFFTRPVAFAKFCVRPEVAQQFDARSRDGRIFIWRRQDDAHDIVAIGRARESEGASIDARGATDLSLFAPVNILFGRGKPIGRARLDFDETERFAFVSDEIDLGMN
jgi:hypothetical protein